MVARLCYEQAQPIGWVADKIAHRNYSYHQLYRFLKSKKGQGLFSTKKEGGLLYIRTNPGTAINLTPPEGRETQNSNKTQNVTEKRYAATEKRYKRILKKAQEDNDENTIKALNDLKRRYPHLTPYQAEKDLQKIEDRAGVRRKHKYGKTGPERFAAISQVLENIDIYPVQDQIQGLFNDYLERIDDSHIILQPDPKQNLFGQLITMEYKTRFNDEGRKKAEVAKYLKIWQQAEARGDWKNAVFLTLTLDPKRYPNLWMANKTLGAKFNKLMSFIARRKGYRPPYLNVCEYQKNGRAHLHIVFFGLRWLMWESEIIKMWKRYNAGEIVKAIPLKHNQETGGYDWVKEKPRDAKPGETCKTYLKKYVLKNLHDEQSSAQYWVYNNRFYTFSRKYFDVGNKPRPSTGLYIFAGVVKGPIGAMASRPGNALGRGSLDPPPRPGPEVHRERERAAVKAAHSNPFRSAYDLLKSI